MNRNTKYSTILAGVMGLSTLVLFHQGAEALDLSDFSGADQSVITKDAPKAGGIVLVKEKVIYPAHPTRVQATVAQPAGRASAPTLTNASSFNAITPAAGGTANAGVVYGDGSTGQPGKGIANKVDITTMPGNAFDQAQAKFNGASASAPVDGKPLTTTTLANGARASDINEISPAAGPVAALAAAPSAPERKAARRPIAVDSGASIQSMTARPQTFNN